MVDEGNAQNMLFRLQFAVPNLVDRSDVDEIGLQIFRVDVVSSKLKRLRAHRPAQGSTPLLPVDKHILKAFEAASVVWRGGVYMYDAWLLRHMFSHSSRFLYVYS